MDINYWAVIVCGIISIVLGTVWYGPIFGKKWMQIMGAENCTEEEMKEKRKGMGILYLVQLLLTILYAYVLARFINMNAGIPAIQISLWLWLGFAFTINAGAGLWNNESKSNAWWRFGITTGYQLLIAIIFPYILGMWK